MDAQKLKQQAEDQASRDQEVAAVQKRRSLQLAALLTPEARERLDRLRMVYPAKAEAVSDLIVNRAENGFIAQRITENQLKQMLDEVTSNKQASTKVSIQRKNYRSTDSDDDDDDDDL